MFDVLHAHLSAVSPLAVYAAGVTAGLAWLLWQARIRPALVSQDDIRRYAAALEDTFGPTYAAALARQEEAAEAAASHDYMSRVWRRVRQELRRRAEGR